MKKILLVITFFVVTIHANFNTNPKEPELKNWNYSYNNEVITMDYLGEYWDTIKFAGSEKEYWYFVKFENGFKCRQFLSTDKMKFIQKCINYKTNKNI